MNILNEKYDALTDNISKFDFLEELISKNITFSLSDYNKILSDDIEVAYFFIDEYHFEDLDEHKKQLCMKFILFRLENADDTEWFSFLDFFKKTSCIEFLNYFKKNDLKLFSDSVKITILNFLETNFLWLNQTDLELLLTEFYQSKNETILNRFVALSVLYKIDFEKYDAVFRKFISENIENESLTKRLNFKINTFPVEIQDFICNSQQNFESKKLTT